MMKLLEPERIYSTGQLLEALQSGLAGLKEQLQVLCRYPCNNSTAQKAEHARAVHIPGR
jgi:hypothetical protein